MTTEARQYTVTELAELGKTSRLKDTLYVLRRWPLIPFFILIVLVVCAAFAPILAPHDPVEDQLRAVLASPAWYPPCEEGQLSNKFASCNTNGVPLGRDQKVYNFALGADQLGRDLLSRIIYGARISLTFASIAITCGTIVGTTLGLVAGYYGGLIDEIIMPHHRRVHCAAVHHSRHFNRDRAGPVIHGNRAGARAGELAGHRASRSRADAADQEFRLHRAGACCRRVHSPNHVQAPSAGCGEHHSGGDDAPGGKHDP